MHSCPDHYCPSLGPCQLQPIGSGGGLLSRNRKNKKPLGGEATRGGIEKGESLEVGVPAGWAACSTEQSSDMRLLRLVIEMSPTSSSCEPNYSSNSS